MKEITIRGRKYLYEINRHSGDHDISGWEETIFYNATPITKTKNNTMKKNHIFGAICIAMLVVGNIVCYAYNDRLLNPMTNFLMLGLTYFNFRKK